jgi:hypothetical protein
MPNTTTKDDLIKNPTSDLTPLESFVSRGILKPLILKPFVAESIF